MGSNLANKIGGEGFFEAAVDTLPAHIAILDSDGRICATNRAWREFGEANGIQMSPDTTGVNYLSVTDDADDIHANLAAAGLRAILDGEREQFEFEYPCHSPDERRWFILRAAPFVQNGERYVSVVHTDITDRKETESRLRATSEMLQFVQETMASSQPLEEKMEHLLDFGREYLGIEQGIFTQIHDGIQEIRVAVGPNEQIQSGESGPVEESYCRHTIDADTPNPLVVEHASEEGWPGDPAFERFGLDCYVGATVLVDGEPYGTICFADRTPADGEFTEPQQTFVELLTEWASYELEQRKRERQYRRLTERISDAYYAFDNDWTITYWNDTIADRLGIPAEEVIGENVWEQFPELIGTVYGKTLRDAMATQERQSCEFYYEPADYWVEVTAHPDDEGISVISTDITERKERTQELAAQRDELAHLHRLNTLVREIIQALQNTDTRDCLESAVCDQLTVSELYPAVWIGTPDRDRAEEVTVVQGTAAGLDDDFPAEIAEADDPVVRALRTGEIQVVDDVTTADTLAEAHRQAVLEHGCHALAAVPLTSENTSHGVLVVYAPDGHTVSDDERDILADLGEMIVLAIQRVNSQRSLAAETAVELDFRLLDADVVFGNVSALLDCELILERLVPTGNGSSLSYHTVRGADPERVAEAVSASDVIDGCTVVREAEDGQHGLIETHISDRSRLPTTVLTDYGSSVTSARAVGGDIHFSAELAPEIDVRTVIDTIRETLPDVELVSKQVVDRSAMTVPALQESLRDTLTPKQQATLEVAYSRGYYSWPRDSTAEELADVLDITAPTLHYRLRRAHQTVLQALLDLDTHGQ